MSDTTMKDLQPPFIFIQDSKFLNINSKNGIIGESFLCL